MKSMLFAALVSLSAAPLAMADSLPCRLALTDAAATGFDVALNYRLQDYVASRSDWRIVEAAPAIVVVQAAGLSGKEAVLLTLTNQDAVSRSYTLSFQPDASAFTTPVSDLQVRLYSGNTVHRRSSYNVALTVDGQTVPSAAIDLSYAPGVCAK